MARDGLFGDLPERPAAEAKGAGAPRLREPIRDQIELRPVDLDSLLGPEHPARVIWDYVQKLDLRELEEAVRAREHTPGQAPASPRLLLALWLYATSQGVGSARALARLCESHDVYRWLCGGVSVNYHGLSDFRVGHGDLLDDLLSQHVAALASTGLINFETLVQDGIRVRANVGAASFRRRATLEQHLAAARVVVEELKREVDDDADASNRRVRAARQRAARERADRVEAALKSLGEVAAQRKRREKKNANQTKKQKEPRASTTEPQARVMKMADGGFRPAWNIQVVSVAEKQIVLAVEPGNIGSDRGLMQPMLQAVGRRLGLIPKRHLADGGFNRTRIPRAAKRGIKATVHLHAASISAIRIPPAALSITHRFCPTVAPSAMSVRRDSPRHMTVLPGGGSLARDNRRAGQS